MWYYMCCDSGLGGNVIPPPHLNDLNVLLFNLSNVTSFTRGSDINVYASRYHILLQI